VNEPSYVAAVKDFMPIPVAVVAGVAGYLVARLQRRSEVEKLKHEQSGRRGEAYDSI